MSQAIVLKEDIRLFRKAFGDSSPNKNLEPVGLYIPAGTSITINDPLPMCFDHRDQDAAMVQNYGRWQVDHQFYVLISEIGQLEPA